MKPNHRTKLEQAITMNGSKMFKLCVVAMIGLTLFTLTQVYYKLVIHLALLVLCFLFCGKAQKNTVAFIAMSLVVCVTFVCMSLMKGHGLISEHIAFFIHYLTWPFLFVGVIHNFEKKEIKWLLYFVIALCIIGNILSLIELGKNPDIARLLAGEKLEGQKMYYLKRGVGGYGHVFGMTFLMFGAIRWLKNSTNKKEKAFLVVFLITDYLYILYAAYTTAITMVIVLTGLAIIAGMKSGSRIFVLVLAIVLVLAFANPILEFAHNLAQDLELDWVAYRLGEIIDVEGGGDMSALRRYGLYKESWDTFMLRPIFGAIQDKGDTWGSHSQILDAFAQYGLFASILLVFWNRCRKTCQKYIPNFKLGFFYIVFYVFATIDTCAAMQIPVIVFFVVPLIAYMESEGQLNENRDPNLSLGS